MKKIPKNKCKGCASRDLMLASFAAHIDEQNAQIEKLQKQLAEKNHKTFRASAKQAVTVG